MDHAAIAQNWRELRDIHRELGEHEEAGEAHRNARWHQEQHDAQTAPTQ